MYCGSWHRTNHYIHLHKKPLEGKNCAQIQQRYITIWGNGKYNVYNYVHFFRMNPYAKCSYFNCVWTCLCATFTCISKHTMYLYISHLHTILYSSVVLPHSIPGIDHTYHDWIRRRWWNRTTILPSTVGIALHLGMDHISILVLSSARSDHAVATLKMEETSELDLTRAMLERTCTLEFASMLWDPSLTVSLTTESSRYQDPPLLYSFITSAKPSVLLPLLSSDVYPWLYRSWREWTNPSACWDRK